MTMITPFGSFSTRTINKAIKSGSQVTWRSGKVTAVKRIGGSLAVQIDNERKWNHVNDLPVFIGN